MLSLAAVLLIVSLLGNEYPRLNHEFPALLASLGLFTAMTAICAASFLSLLYAHKFRWIAQAMMWSTLVAVGAYYWP
jgi:hypothetical protein